MFWRREERLHAGQFVARSVWMAAGMTVLALGIRYQVLASLGLGPWEVLQMGVTFHLPITYGQANILVGLVLVLATSLMLRRWPRLGTVINMVYVGAAYDLLDGWGLPAAATPDAIAWRWGYLLLGIGLLGFGSAWYMTAGFGAGPRDGMMMALSSKTRLDPGSVRVAMECTSVATGYVLGGPVGAGTIVVALLTGPTIARGLPLFRAAGTALRVISAEVAAPPAKVGAPRLQVGAAPVPVGQAPFGKTSGSDFR